jgi:V8-like Glu-specific endopeptidase
MAWSENKVIYGEDNRQDLIDVTNPAYLELARSTAGMIDQSKLTFNGVDTYTIAASSLQSHGVCSYARFSEQATAANCSGFLVGEDLLVTAGHCMDSFSDCRINKWVFDYSISSEDTNPMQVPASSVYGCKEILVQTLDSSTLNDFALIRLTRKVTDRRILTFRTAGKIEDASEILVIGHPTGLPTKVADGAFVRGNDNPFFFVTNLDTFGGNSGSAVFNAKTGAVEGILVRGETDYIIDPGKSCRVPNRCTMDACRGEDVTRITNLSEEIRKYSMIPSTDLISE